MSVVVEELNFGNEAEVLSREELKKVLGGMGSGSGGDANCYICEGDGDPSYDYGACATEGQTCQVPSQCRDYKCDRSWGNG